jgi:Ni/Co efflux regulator RcnB
MNTKHLMIPALLAALMASAPGFAQDRDHDRGGWSQNDRDHGNNDRGNYDHGNNDRGNYDRGNNDRGNDRRDGYAARGGGRGGNDGYGGGEHHWDGAGPEHSWRRGDRLPTQYRNNQYVVNDWRGHHLRQPPRGYHWVQSGSDYVLAAVATGVIADLIINSR